MTYIPDDIRHAVMNRARDCCEYCLTHQQHRFFKFHIDHIEAIKHGGVTALDNLCLACVDCNRFKGTDLTSIDRGYTNQIHPLFNPRQQQWQSHFQINFQTGELVPLSATGRVTVRLLRLNDIERVEDRLLLIEDAQYPCDA
ncbi:MAG: HNH endonuclease [Phototrophicaceae bacterium]|jgi:hypothetical protein